MIRAWLTYKDMLYSLLALRGLVRLIRAREQGGGVEYRTLMQT